MGPHASADGIALYVWNVKFSHRSSVDGVDTLYSIATVESGIAHFECLASASGRCVYTVFPETCAGATGLAGMRVVKCGPATPTRFSLAEGRTREVAGLRVKSLCVRADDALLSPACERPEALAAR